MVYGWDSVMRRQRNILLMAIEEEYVGASEECFEGQSGPRRGPLLGQLVIVSNRVAVPERNAKARAGGLEVAVQAALKRKSGIWFGWSGKVATQTKIATRRVVHDKITYITLDLSKEDHQDPRCQESSGRHTRNANGIKIDRSFLKHHPDPCGP
jgi:hypothetical protein